MQGLQIHWLLFEKLLFNPTSCVHLNQNLNKQSMAEKVRQVFQPKSYVRGLLRLSEKFTTS